MYACERVSDKMVRAAGATSRTIGGGISPAVEGYTTKDEITYKKST